MYSDNRLIVFDADGTTVDAFSAINLTFATHNMDIGDIERFQNRRHIFKYLGGLRELPEYSAEIIIGAPAVFFAANKMWAAENAEVLTDFVEVMQMAHDWANKNPDEVRRIDVENTPLPPEYLMSRPYAGLQSEFQTSLWEQQVTGLAKYDFISREVAIDEFVWSGAPTK
jgi:hypothetical protein